MTDIGPEDCRRLCWLLESLHGFGVATIEWLADVRATIASFRLGKAVFLAHIKMLMATREAAPRIGNSGSPGD